MLINMKWWGIPDPSEVIDENLVDEMIRDADRAIDQWQSRWQDYMHQDERGAILEYHARFTRFCVNSYAVKHVRNSPQGLTPLQSDQIQRCMACASHVLDWSISRGE